MSPNAARAKLVGMAPLPFATVAARRGPALDELALALAGELRAVDEEAALAELDRLGRELAEAVVTARSAAEEVEACAAVLGAREGFAGRRQDYDDPGNSMLDLVLERRRGLPILLSIVYVEAARRAGIELAGVGLPGHYVVGHFGAEPPLLLDPFGGGGLLPPVAGARRWGGHETALRMLNNLVPAYARRGDLARALRVAELRLALPVADAARDALELELRGLHARLN